MQTSSLVVFLICSSLLVVAIHAQRVSSSSNSILFPRQQLVQQDEPTVFAPDNHQQQQRRRLQHHQQHYETVKKEYHKGKGKGMSYKGKGKGKGKEMSYKGKGKGTKKSMSYKGKGGKGSYKGKGKGKGYYKGNEPVPPPPPHHHVPVGPPTEFPTFSNNLPAVTDAPTRACNEQECCTDADCGNVDTYECTLLGFNNRCALRNCVIDPDMEIDCCDDTDCALAEQRCTSNRCIHTGHPRITLTWYGNDDLDLHVITPAGTTINFLNRQDAASGGTADIDGLPGGRTGRWVENVWFDDTLVDTSGTYTYFVVSYNARDQPDNFDLAVWEGPFRVAFDVSGGLETSQNSTQYTYTKP